MCKNLKPYELESNGLCLLFQKSDVSSTLELLKRCSTYYHSGELTQDCLNNPRPCIRVPRECIKHNAVFTILHYLTDHDFMSPASVSELDTATYYVQIYKACLVTSHKNHDKMMTKQARKGFRPISANKIFLGSL